MAVESQTLYKLIVLYMLDRVDFPLSNATVIGYINESGLTDYPTILTVIDVLQADGLIDVESNRSNTSYALTDQGLEMLEYFGNKISDDIKAEINEYLKRNKYELKQAANILSESYLTNNGEFAVHCCVKERNATLVDLTVTVPDEEVADQMCMRWKQESSDIYEFIIKKLMGDSETQ